MACVVRSIDDGPTHVRHDRCADDADGDEKTSGLDQRAGRQVAVEDSGPVGLDAVQQDAEAD